MLTISQPGGSLSKEKKKKRGKEEEERKVKAWFKDEQPKHGKLRIVPISFSELLPRSGN